MKLQILLIFTFVTEPWSRKKPNWRGTLFNLNSVTIERMFSKMQNCVSLGRVSFLRERQGDFCQKNLHLFSSFRTMFLVVSHDSTRG